MVMFIGAIASAVDGIVNSGTQLASVKRQGEQMESNQEFQLDFSKQNHTQNVELMLLDKELYDSCEDSYNATGVTGPLCDQAGFTEEALQKGTAKAAINNQRNIGIGIIAFILLIGFFIAYKILNSKK